VSRPQIRAGKIAELDGVYKRRDAACYDPIQVFFVVVAQADKLRARQNQERHIKVSRTKLERRAGFTRLQECAYV
jgi:hypothetical protein